MNQLVRIEFDGGSRGNPGPAAGAGIIFLAKEIIEASQFLPSATNNEAEYTGALLGLRKAVELELQSIELAGDSQLVVRQLSGEWEVKTPHLRPLWQEAQSLMRKLGQTKLCWLPRDKNKLADTAVNRCIDAGLGIDRSGLVGLVAPAPTPHLAGVIESLIQKQAQGQVKFQDLLRLRVGGKDEFSALRLSELRDRVPDDLQLAMMAGLGANCSDEAMSTCFRWYLRGLPPELAARKVAVDLEIAASRSKTKT